MGWRKLTIPDGDLARCGALQRAFSDRAGTQNSDLGDHLLRQHLSLDSQTRSGWSDRRVTVRLAGLGTVTCTASCSNGAVTARCLCSDSRGLGIRMPLSKLSTVREQLDLGLLAWCVDRRCCRRSGCGRDGIGPFEDDWLDGQHVNVTKSEFRRAVVRAEDGLDVTVAHNEHVLPLFDRVYSPTLGLLDRELCAPSLVPEYRASAGPEDLSRRGCFGKHIYRLRTPLTANESETTQISPWTPSRPSP
jgi:hypothetical protein